MPRKNNRGKTSPNGYKCSRCGSKTTTLGQMRGHYRTAHPAQSKAWTNAAVSAARKAKQLKARQNGSPALPTLVAPVKAFEAPAKPKAPKKYKRAAVNTPTYCPNCGDHLAGWQRSSQ